MPQVYKHLTRSYSQNVNNNNIAASGRVPYYIYFLVAVEELFSVVSLNGEKDLEKVIVVTKR